MICSNCGGSSFRKNGFVNLASGRKQAYRCKDCGKTTYEKEEYRVRFESSKFEPNVVLNGSKYVITSVQNNTEVNWDFYYALMNYCKKNDAELIIIPVLHNQTKYIELEWPFGEDQLFRQKASLNGMLNILSNINIVASSENPLAGLDTLSKGKSLIVPHNQLQMRSLPVQRDDHPVILHTTGTLSRPNYSMTKAGEKAEFNHSFSALVVEFEGKGYHVRVLNADTDNGFYDIDGYYTDSSFTPLDRVEALITGDEHVIVTSHEVSRATYLDDDSIVKTLKPKVIVRHDVLDCFTVSHHHRKDNFLQYSKFMNNMNSIESELNETIQYILGTTPEDSQTYIVSSNHHDHLKRWLNECDPKLEPWNAKIYHQLTYLMLEEIEKRDHIYSPDPFYLYANKRCPGRINFIGRNESFKIKNIELSNHGDVGANGSRGSINQYARFADKAVIGHSHTPGINKGAYSVGTSTPKKLEYTNGPSSWMNTHCVIYPNGKRQLISIIGGKWKKSG